MSVWAGWQADLLSHSSVPNTADNRRFLTDWHAHAETNCHNNPIDLSARTAGASNCKQLPGLNVRAQNYSTTGNAVHAFAVQIESGTFSDLKAAMLTGNPYTADNTGLASEDLTAWGSQAFAKRYFSETANAPGRGGGPVSVTAPRAHKGWNDIRQTANRHWPAALAYSDRHIRAALRSVGRARRVGG